MTSSLERIIKALADRALAQARAQEVDLLSPLRGVEDWDIDDFTTVTVRDTLRKEFPWTRADAAIPGAYEARMLKGLNPASFQPCSEA